MLVIGALSLYEGWGCVSLVLVYTAFGLALIKSACFKMRIEGEANRGQLR